MKIKAAYQFVNLAHISDLWLKLVGRSGEHTIMDELSEISSQFKLKIFKKKNDRIVRTGILSASSIIRLQSEEIKLSWYERKGIGYSSFHARDENILFFTDDHGMEVLVFDNDIDSRMRQYFGIGMFVPQPDKEIEQQLTDLKKNGTLI